jgi:hypothetical protein
MSHELEEQIARSVLKRFPGAEQAAKEIAQEALSTARAGEDVVERAAQALADHRRTVRYNFAKMKLKKMPKDDQEMYHSDARAVLASASFLRLPEAAPGWPNELIDGLQEQVLERRSAPSKLRGTHLDWMLDQIKQGIVVGTKAHRWFAFVQGVLAERGAVDVDDERDRTRPFFKAMLTAAGVEPRGMREAADKAWHTLKQIGMSNDVPKHIAATAMLVADLFEREYRATPPTPSADTHNAALMKSANELLSAIDAELDLGQRRVISKRADELRNALAKSSPAPANGEPEA